MLPFSQTLIGLQGWKGALIVLAAVILVIVPLSLGLARASDPEPPPGDQQSLGAALREAWGQTSFRYLTAGFFVCGFQIAFIAVHLPAFLADNHLPAIVGATALGLIGLFNIFGSFAAGYFGGRVSKKLLLSGTYFVRTLILTLFLLVPLTPGSVYAFAAGMGFLWLGTVPLTNGLVAHIFGVRYLATLFGIVFFSHQVGSFLGVWLGGYLFDLSGSYTPVWIACLALGLLASLLNLPIDERPLPRAQSQAG